jgi:hypothetical protein
MSEQINDGGSALPTADAYHPSGQIAYGRKGMTLRDWFAGQALNALVTADSMENHKQLSADGQADGTYFGRSFVCQDYWYEVSQSAYAVADAMLKARGGAK